MTDGWTEERQTRHQATSGVAGAGALFVLLPDSAAKGFMALEGILCPRDERDDSRPCTQPSTGTTLMGEGYHRPLLQKDGKENDYSSRATLQKTVIEKEGKEYDVLGRHFKTWLRRKLLRGVYKYL